MAFLKSFGFWLPLILVLLLGGLPLLSHQTTVRETVFGILLLVSLAASLNIMVGYTGYVSFGHIVFFGLGGYTGFYLIAIQKWSLLPAALVGGATATILALALGSAILRLRGAYFALATIGINEAARAFVGNFQLFGAAKGLEMHFGEYSAYGGTTAAQWTVFYYMVAITAFVLAMSYVIKHSRFGLGLLSIREDEDAAIVMGVRAPLQKTVAYGLSAFVPGVVGTLFFFKNAGVEPNDAFRLETSIEILVVVMLGGQGTVLGALIGGAAYERLRGFLVTNLEITGLHQILAGFVLLLIILFIPAGLVGWIRQKLPKIRGVLE